MKRLLIFLVLLPCMGFAVSDVVVEDQLEVTSSTNGWEIFRNPVSNQSAGKFALVCRVTSDGATARMTVFTTTDYGANWSSASLPMSTLGGISPSGWYYNDINTDTFVVTFFDTFDSLMTTAIIGGTIGDSIGAAFDRIDGANRGGVFKVGGRFCIEYNVDAAAGTGSDSSMVIIADSDGWPPSGWHLGPVINGTKTGFGKRLQCHLGDGFLVFHRLGTDNDFWMVDSTDGFQEIVTSSFLPVYAASTGPVLGSYDIIMTDDSVGFVIVQASLTAGADSVIVANFTITDYAGTAGVTLGSWTKLATEAQIRDGAYTFPALSWLYGTDTGYAYWLQWADTSSADSMDVMISTTTDRGATWSAGTVWRAADVSDPRFRLQAPDWLYLKGSDVVRAVFASGSNTADDTLHMITDTLVASSPPAAESGATVIRQATIRSTSTR
ncbi:MAG: hypothetical protein WC565_09525 [Parcubacteria group bacterium]